MQLIPLGTSAAIPTRERQVAAFALVRDDGTWILFDAGDGVQYRVASAGLKLNRLEAVLISHLHGDHIFGLPGLLATASLLGRATPLLVWGPTELGRFIDASFAIGGSSLGFDLDLRDTREERELTLPGLDRVRCRPLEHSIPCWGFRWEERLRSPNLDVELLRARGLEPGPSYGLLKQGQDVQLANGEWIRAEDVALSPRPRMSLAYCSDTRPCDEAVDLARGVDVIIHEATYGDEHEALAIERAHSTAREAALIAQRAGASQLVLTHFSSRYTSVERLVAEAGEIFANTVAATDLVAIGMRSHDDAALKPTPDASRQ